MRYFTNTGFAACLVAGSLWLGAGSQAETWTDSSGNISIEAKFLGAKDGKVALQKQDGSKIVVPFAKLDANSQALARKLYAEMQGAGGGAAPAAAAAPRATGAVAAGGSKLGANPSAQQTVDALTAAMAEMDLDTLWDMFPKRYQADINGVIQSAAQNIDTPVWNGVGGVVKKVSQLVATKRDFILNNKNVQGFVPNTPETLASWDATSKLLGAVANSSLTNHAQMKNFAMANFLQSDGQKIKAAGKELSEIAASADPGQGQPIGGKPPEFRLVSDDGQTAQVEVTESDGRKHTEAFVKVDNRWVPQEMAEEWDEKMAEAKQAIAKLATPEGKQQMSAVPMGLMMVTGPLDQMLAAKTQQEFDQVVDPLVQQFGMMLGPMLMGGGGPPGAFGAGGPPGFGGGDFGGGPPGGEFRGGDLGADAFGEAPAN